MRLYSPVGADSVYDVPINEDVQLIRRPPIADNVDPLAGQLQLEVGGQAVGELGLETK